MQLTFIRNPISYIDLWSYEWNTDDTDLADIHGCDFPISNFILSKKKVFKSNFEHLPTYPPN